MRKPILRALVAVLWLAGCGGGDGNEQVAVVRSGAELIPGSRGELRVESDQPLSFGAVVSVDSATLLVTDRNTSDVWRIDASSADVRMERVLRGDQRVRAALVALAAGETELRLLDRSGGVYLFDRSSWQLRGTTRIEYGEGRIVAAAGDAASGFALLVRRRSREGTVPFEYALVLLDSAGAARETWRSASSGVSRGGADLLSLARADSGWLLAGSDPARVLHFDAAGMLQHEQTILSTPERKLSPELIAHFQRLASAAGAAGSVQPPSRFPPITALRRYGDAYLAVPYVGGSTGEAQGLDVYCDLRYSRTLLDAPDILQVLLTEHAILVISEATATSYVVDVYRAADLPLACEAAQ
jgi:hypothetical protein